MKKILMIFIFFILISFLFCDINEIVLDDSKSVDLISQLNENEVFFKFINGLDIDENNNIYFLDRHFATIFKINLLNKKLIKTISSKGQGPGELLCPCSMKIKDNKIYILDMGLGSVKIFGLKGICLKEFKCNFSCTFLYENSIMDVSNTNEIYIKNIDKKTKTAISVYDNNGKKIRNIIKLGNKNEKDYKNWFFNTFFSFKIDRNDNIVLLFLKKGELKKYDKKGNLIWFRNIYDDLKNKEKIENKFKQKKTKKGFQFKFNLIFLGLFAKDDFILVSHKWGGIIYNKRGKLIKYIRQKSNKGFGANFIWKSKKLYTYEKIYFMNL